MGIILKVTKTLINSSFPIRKMEDSLVQSLQLSRIQSDPASTAYSPSDYDEDNLKDRNGLLWDDVSDGEVDKTVDLDREWQRRHDQFHAIGYRDGLIAGKEASAQEGFNMGFKQSVPAGYKWGLVRGVTSALACLPDGLREKLVEKQGNQNKFQHLYESAQSISTSDALKLFHHEIVGNKSAGQERDAEASTSAASTQQQNPNHSRMENYYEQLKSLLTETPAIELHSILDP